MGRIEHIVYLMLENRSLDNVLGWLYARHERPRLHPPDSLPVYFDGLDHDPPFGNRDDDGRLHVMRRGTGGSFHEPPFDPHEQYAHVTMQLFGTEATPVHGTPATMDGFVQDYGDGWFVRPEQIMSSYTPAELPVLNGLARDFAVSDRYFSSVPTQTDCNRAFAAAGNSLGVTDAGRREAWVDNRNLVLGRPTGEQFDQRTMWNVLDENGRGAPTDWMIFHSNGTWLEDHVLQTQGYDFTRNIMATLQDPRFDANFAPVGAPGDTGRNSFFGRVAGGDLPAFSFIEPKWGLGLGRTRIGFQGTDYHPPFDVRPGEAFLDAIVTALRDDPAIWDGLLFIVNFDEHGGTYDHVPPPWTAVPPWCGDHGTPAPEFLEGGFGFDRFGVRVPLILVSPHVTPGTVFRAPGDVPYDHTSVIATILTLLDVPEHTWRLGARVAAAPRFDDVLTRSGSDGDGTG